MKNHAFLCLFTIGILTGCGGSGSGGSNASPFAGTYQGTYASTATDNDDNGTFAITIASDGTIGGTATDSRYGDNGTVTSESTIDRQGTVLVRIAFSSGGAGTLSTSFRGTLSGNPQTTLTGTLNEKQGDIDVPFDFTLNRITN